MELLDAKDLRKMLKVSLPLIYKWADQGRIPCVRVPCPGNGTKKRQNLVRFKLTDVHDFIETHYRK